ncbi:MAG: hypothetical protein EKK48_29245 [Candidatus Melainabacteria bacterium]|nr:MAG: hypothetical protein EKK48_29245 [Candidatus Melainabacteria bacterium]
MSIKSRFLSLFVIFSTIASASSLPAVAIDIDLDSRDSREALAKPSPQARKLAEKIVEAYGGIEKIKNLNELMYKAKGTIKESSMISGAENTFDCLVFARGDKTRVELNILGQPVVTGYNGSQSWVKQGDNVFPTDATTAKHIQLEVEHGLKLLERIAERNSYLALGEPQSVNGKLCQTLLIRASDGKFSRFSIDPTTNLVVRNEYTGIDLEQGLKTVKANDYLDYRPIFGTQLPYTTIEYNDGKKSTETLLTEIELVPNGNDTIFDMPLEIPIARLKQGPIKMPFEYKGNEVMVKSKINGKPEVALILDTGATTTVLNSADATNYGIAKTSDFKMTTGSGTIKTSYITLSSLSLGDLTLNNVPVAVSDLPGFRELPGEKPVGIIGADILRRFLVCIDYENREVSFSDPREVKVPEDAIVVPTEPALGAAGLVVQGKLDGQPLTMLVDTGAAFNNVSEHLVKKLLKSALLPVGKVEGLDGQKISIGAVMFKNLKIGPLTVPNPIFSVAPDTIPGAPKGIIVNGALAILGNPFWSHFKLTIDYRNQRLLLQRSKTQEQFEAAMAEIDAIDEKYWRSHDAVAAASQLKDLSKKLESRGVLSGASVCLARSALYSAIDLKSFDAAHASDLPTRLNSINADFKNAERLATTSKDKTALAEVLAANATYSLKYSMPPNTAAVKALLSTAMSYSPTNVSVSLACYWLAKQLKSKTASQIVDQVLMTQPNNWDALWERYRDAKAQANSRDQTLIVEQLKRYYSGFPDVEAIDTESSAGTNP